MAVYKQGKKEKKTRKFHISKKAVGITFIVISCLAFFFLFTNLLPFMRKFIFGTFGYFSYVLFVYTFMLGVALVNNKKYTMSKKYTAFLYLSIIFLLCIIQMIMIGDKGNLSFGQYLAKNYTHHCIGGVMIGLLTTSILYLTGIAWTYVIFCVCFIISVALFINLVVYMHRQKRADAPVKINIKPSRNFKEEESEVFDNKFEEKEKEEQSARKKLGLAGRGALSFEEQEKEEVKKKLEGEELKRMILTPPEVDLKFFEKKEEKTYQPNRPTVEFSPRQEDIANNINELKREELEGDTIQEQSFEERDINPIEEIKPESVVSAVDDMLKDAMRESGVEPIQSTIDDIEEEIQTPVQPEKKEKKFIDIDGDDKKKEEPYVPYKYTKPPVRLIQTNSTDMSEVGEECSSKTIILENTLEQFGVPAKVQKVIVGPAVARYELEMPTGVTVKKILNLSSDIALALEANGGDVRIEAPVPGRNVVGIEIPNDKVAMVSLRDILVSNEFNSAKSPLSFAVGKDITGSIQIGALNKMPHLLIAGTTGSGKSVMLNSIILSFLYKASPEEVRLLLIDPKRVEFMPYEGLPHLIIPKVITDVPKASNALTWALDEMERRFSLFADARVKDIGEYNTMRDVVLAKKKKMPYIVIIIDEFSDFIMQGKKEIEDKIVRLGQKARAAGIHLILATQRPTAEFVTGGIKANFPSKIAFKVSSRVNSDVIIGMTGAEKLLGHGDMLYAPIEYSSAPKRIQGCYMTTQEIGDIVNFVIQNNETCFDQEIIDEINNPKKSGATGGGGNEAMDPMLPEALKLGIECGQISGSFLQRKLSLGWPRAAKIIDQLADMGYISPSDGTTKPRSIYITLEEFYSVFGDSYR